MVNLTKEDIVKLINDEIVKFNSKELDKNISKEIRNKTTISHKEVVDIIKNALVEMNKTLWMRKETWLNNIK